MWSFSYTKTYLLKDARLGDNKQIESYERKERKTREDLTYLRTNKLTLLKTGAYTPDDFLTEENKLNNELMTVQEEKQLSDVSMHEVMKDVVKLSELLKDTAIYYSLANSTEKEQITRVIFSELSVSETTFDFSCKNGFQAFESRFTAVCGPMGWLSELGKWGSEIGFSIKSLEAMTQTPRSTRGC